MILFTKKNWKNDGLKSSLLYSDPEIFIYVKAVHFSGRLVTQTADEILLLVKQDRYIYTVKIQRVSQELIKNLDASN